MRAIVTELNPFSPLATSKRSFDDRNMESQALAWEEYYAQTWSERNSWKT